MYKHIMVISHRRSGTHLLIDAIRNNFLHYRAKHLDLESLLPDSRQRLTVEDFEHLLQEGPRVIKTHMHAHVEEYFAQDRSVLEYVRYLFATAHTIYIYRDGRDVMTSLYYYMGSYKPEIAQLPFSQFLRTSNDFAPETYSGTFNRIEFWRYHVSRWIEEEKILPISFEDMHQTYKASLAKVAVHINETLPRQIQHVVRCRDKATTLRSPWLERFFRYTNRALRGRKYSSVAFRKGTVGDYMRHFSPEDLVFFDHIAGQLLEELGYPTSYCAQNAAHAKRTGVIP